MKIKVFVSKHRKVLRIIAAVIAFAMIGALLLFANSLLGNPVSYLIVKNNAQKYLVEKYDGYVLEDVSYSFKMGDYLAHASIPRSGDSHFAVYYGWDCAFWGDTYESDITNRGNVRRRLDMSYRKLVDSVLDSAANPYSMDIDFGELIFEGDEDTTKEEGHGFFLPLGELEQDGLYNIAELGEKAGLLNIYVETEKDASPETAAEFLLGIKSLMEKGGATFRAIDLVVRSPNGGYIVDNFLRSDIYEDGLAERVGKIGMTTEEYNAAHASDKTD